MLDAGAGFGRHAFELARQGASVVINDVDADTAQQAVASIEAEGGKAVAVVFEKPSTRTRLSFEVGIAELGAHPVILDAQSTQLGRGETIKDTAIVLSRYLDAIMIRTFKQSDVDELAKHASIPVLNGLTDDFHPCQALADVMTIRERFGELSGVRVAYLGDGNNVCHSLMVACAKLGANFVAAVPEGYEPSAEVVTWARAAADPWNATVEIVHDAVEGAAGAPEFAARAGGTDEAVIRDLYDRLLHRVPGEGELAFWLDQAVERTNGSIAADMVFSRESRSDRVTALHQSILGRDADPEGLVFWVDRLRTVNDVRLAVEPGAGEGEVEVDRPVAVGVGDLAGHADPREPVDPDGDARLLEGLTGGGDSRLLPGVDDAGDGRPRAVVDPPDQQDLDGGPGAASYDRGHPGQPQQVVADVTAEIGDERRDGHAPDASAALGTAGVAPRPGRARR